jgi:hypothetical protein
MADFHLPNRDKKPTNFFGSPSPGLPPRRPQSLADLMAHGEYFADQHLRQIGRVPATCFLVGAKGPIIFQPVSMSDGAAKDRFALAVKLFCVAHAATAVVLVMEAWASFATPEQPLDPKERPSEALHRREIVMVVGESRETVIQKCLPIVRTGAGSYFGLGEDAAPPNATLEGRFAPQFLPPLPPSPKQQRWAMQQLRKEGLIR